MLEQKGVRLENANVVVSGGRGVGGPDGFEQLKELAECVLPMHGFSKCTNLANGRKKVFCTKRTEEKGR